MLPRTIQGLSPTSAASPLTQTRAMPGGRRRGAFQTSDPSENRDANDSCVGPGSQVAVPPQPPSERARLVRAGDGIYVDNQLDVLGHMTRSTLCCRPLYRYRLLGCPTMGLIQLRVEGLFDEFTHEIK